MAETSTETSMNPVTPISGIPVSSLYPDRYGFGKSKLYEILKECKITPYRDGKTACITVEQLHQLDRYLVHGEAPNTPVETSLESSVESSAYLMQPRPASVEMSTLPPALQLIVEAIASRMTATPPDPLLPQRQLQELCDRRWFATTTQLTKILGVRPRPGMTRYGFELQPRGKMGREGCWQINQCP